MYRNLNKKIIATIEARMLSSRLPGKVLMLLAGRPALEHLIRRLQRSKYLDEIIVATTINRADNPIVELTKRLKVKYFRGSENDVLGRVLAAAESVNGDIIVEILGDCPLVDPDLVDRGIEEFFSHDVDYASNTIKPSYPNGFDVQIFSREILAKVDKLTQNPIDRVHVSYYIYTHPKRYRLHNWEAEKEYQAPDLRVTLDEEADYQLLNIIFEKLLPLNENFGYREVINFLKNNPYLAKINKYVRQKDPSEG